MTDYTDLIAALRLPIHGAQQEWTCRKAADALEAMAGEVENQKCFAVTEQQRAALAEAERDRLKAALQPFSDAYERLVRTQESMGFSDNATFGLGIKVSAIKVARKALGGDAS